MMRRFQIFLGPRGFRAFAVLLAITGFGSLLLTVVAEAAPWAKSAQTLLLAIFLAGAAYLILSRLPREERLRWLALILPSVIAMGIASVLLPHLTGLIAGAGLGWIVAGIFVFNRSGASKNTKRAVRAMRKGDYDSAINAITTEINQHPSNAEHYRFRAELYRLAGKLNAARKDYRKMIALNEQSAVACNGLAEVELQARNFDRARQAALKAYELSPDEWVAAYNLGMIEDRLKLNEAAIQHLKAALALRMPDSRHRLLAHLYLFRAYQRIGDDSQAEQERIAMKKERAGLEEWQVIMGADEAKALRAVLSNDIQTAKSLMNGGSHLSAIGLGEE